MKLCSATKKKGGPPKYLNFSNDFCESIRKCDLIDIGYSGDRYTWTTNKNSREATKERLDKFFENSKMSSIAKKMRVEHLNYLHLDHHPILLKISWVNSVQQAGSLRNLIRLEESWLNHKGSKMSFKDSWNSSLDTSNVNFSRKIQEGLKAMKCGIKKG